MSNRKIKISESQFRKMFGDKFTEFLSEDSVPGTGFGGAQSKGKRAIDLKPGEAFGKIHNLGRTNLGGNVKDPSVEHPENTVGLPTTSNDFINSVVRYIYKENGGPVNILDALEIINKLKGKDISNELRTKGVEFNEATVKNFLDTLDIATILSNYLLIDQNDYVYYRLANLKPDEIDRIKKEYGKDFAEWGKKCGGCGLEEWRTNVLVNSGDDAHINMEYMGAAGKSTDGKNIGEMKVYRIPFQIHHMNEVPTDNSPLNLACLCPNCHSLTGSYAKDKATSGLNTAELRNLFETERNSVEQNDEIAKKISEDLSHGHFLNTTISDKMSDEYLANTSISQEKINETVEDIMFDGKEWFFNDLKSKKSETDKYKTSQSEPQVVFEAEGVSIYASFIGKGKDKLLVKLYTNPGNGAQVDTSSNLSFDPVEIPVSQPDPQNPEQVTLFKQRNDYAAKKLSMYITTALRKNAYGSASLLNRWGGSRTGDVKKYNDLAKERDVDAYNSGRKDMFPKITNPINQRKADEVMAKYPNSEAWAKVAQKLRNTPDNV